MSALPKIEAKFNEFFTTWGLRLPPEAISHRQRGRILQAGWVVWYLFDADDQGEYLDFYATHRMGGDHHRRLRANGGRECLPTLQRMYASSADPEEAQRLVDAFFAENQRVADLLAAKGFCLQGDEPSLTVINRHLLSHPRPLRPEVAP